MQHIHTFEAFRSETKKIYYHGRGGTRSFGGNYLYVTDCFEYAATYAEGTNEVYAFTLNFPESDIFTIRNTAHLRKVAKLVDAQAIQSVLNAAMGGEMDWTSVDYLSNDDFDCGEELLQSLGFRAMKLRERPYAESILVFDQTDAELVEMIDLTTPERVAQMGAWYKGLDGRYNHL